MTTETPDNLSTEDGPAPALSVAPGSALGRAIASKLNAAFNLYAWDDSEDEAAQIVSDGIRELEAQHREMRSILLRIHSARIGMNEAAVVAALDDVDRFFREPNFN